MKKIIHFQIILLLLFIGCSDRMDEVIEYQFALKNESGANIEIISYNHLRPNITPESIKIKDGSVYRESFFSRQSQETYNFLNVFGGDSIVITYDKEKQQIFYCYNFYSNNEQGCDEPRNILSFLEITDIDSEGNVSLFRYTFTPEDFVNAEPCNGECR